MAEAGLLDLYREGLSDGEIARRVGTDKHRVRRWRQKEGLPPNSNRRPLTGEEIAAQYTQSISGDDWPFGLPRPIQVNVSPRDFKPPESGGMYIQVSLSDSHFPFHDPRYNAVALQIIEDLNPQLVVHHGDLLDCYKISRFEKDPKHRVSLQEEIEMGAAFLGEIAAVSPNAERWLIKGNHEDRLRKVVWDIASNHPQAAQILQLPNVWEQLSWPKLLGLESMGWQWVETKKKLFGKLILKHGTIVRKWSAGTAKGEYEKYGMSGMSGHTHRAGAFYHSDHNGPHAWFELGCGCTLDPSYCEDPDWQQALSVVTWNASRTRYSVEQVIVHDGTAIFRGRQYTA